MTFHVDLTIKIFIDSKTTMKSRTFEVSNEQSRIMA